MTTFRTRVGPFGLPSTFFGFVMAVALSDIGDSFRVLALDAVRHRRAVSVTAWGARPALIASAAAAIVLLMIGGVLMLAGR